LLQPETPEGPAVEAPLPFLGAVKVTVDVRVGRLESTVGELLALREGTVLTLDRAVDRPLDVLLDGHVVARGTLVAVGDHFGLRLTETPAMCTSREPA
jgi:flagellar motor switch protein FliN/FliY